EVEAETPLPSQLLLYLTLSTAGATPLAVLARVIEVRRRRVRVSFDPLPELAARALVQEIVVMPASRPPRRVFAN
ncbi:MAG: hypothetical protein ACYCWW_17655, partial [Deltaproteobacteria bacterium]